MPDILFCLFYLLLFSLLILKSKWFNADSFNNKHFLLIFYLKLLFGVGLWYIYTHIYKNRTTSDIFKYYDDAGAMYNTLHTSIKDYFVLLTGIGDSNAHYQSIYHSLNSWDNGYDSILYNNSHFIIRLNTFFRLFSQGHYGVHVIFMCFIALAGFVYIYKAFIPFLQKRSKELFAAIFLFPSVILWSSGILKESLIWLGLGLSVYYFFQLINVVKFYLKYFLLILLGFVILYESKAYVLLCLLPCFIAHFLIKKNGYCKTHSLLTYLTILLLYMGSAFLPHLLLNKISPLTMISDKQIDFNRSTRGGIYLQKMNDSTNYAFISLADSINIIPLNTWADTLLHKKGVQYLATKPFWSTEFKSRQRAPYMLKKGTPYADIRIRNKDTAHLIANDSTAYWVCIYVETANSRINIEPIKPTVLSLFAHIPQALEVSILLPYPWQVHSTMTAIYCAENIFVLLLFFITLFFIKRPIPNKDIVLFCLCYCVLMLVLIGLTTPILGAIERYKSVVIPFMFILLLLIIKKPIAKSE